MRVIFIWLSLLALALRAWASPFDVEAELRPSGVFPALLIVRVGVPEGHRLYADEFKLKLFPEVPLEQVAVPEPTDLPDSFSGAIKPVYTSGFTAVYALTELPEGPLTASITYLGCDEFICFLPVTVDLVLRAGAVTEEQSAPSPVDAMPDWRALLARFTVRDSQSGYLRPRAFMEFLESAVRLPDVDTEDGSNDKKGLWWLLTVVLLGGLALNLTPCVLPMVPVNLAIIGAGMRTAGNAASRWRGFRLGLLYGAGIALAYGSLGLVVMLTGRTFGTINATPWFNFSVGLLFLVMAAAMFDLLVFDFSRWQSRWSFQRMGGVAVFLMGALSALLAGACVAPVVITVLTYAMTWYAEGYRLSGLLLPFMLGLGMALPWPAAGAGLAVLPKPGAWMQWVKRIMGLLILLLALYYLHQGWRLMEYEAVPAVESEPAAGGQRADWLTDLPAALLQAESEDRPLLIDFWATWCKNCLAMDETTLRHPDVLARMRGFVLLKYQAERPDHPQTREVLDAFKVLGLPTYVVLTPGRTVNGEL
ncbi:MAG: cytochrome c biogenesis protein CcdA [Kiritimatiellia bacterium]|nr:thioredoxin family protein [Lentisphaerota bacterium]